MSHADPTASIVIATPLEDDLVARVRAAAAPRMVSYDASLIPSPRYRGDHRGDPAFRLNATQLEHWHELLMHAEIVLGIPGESVDGLRETIGHAPRLRWVQSMFAGGGETVGGATLPRATLESIAFTTTAGVHGTMLAEFAFFGILALRKHSRRLDELRMTKTWQRFPMDELRGATLAVVGTGHIGGSVAHLGHAFGMRVIGVARDGRPRAGFDEIVAIEQLIDACARCDVLALALPGTLATHRLIGPRELAALSPAAIVVNVGRGTAIDQASLTKALLDGRVAGAVLDVFDPEPLPPNDPLWTLENVVMAPHTATLSIHENERIVELFIDNLARYERGESLRNRVNIDEFY